MIWNRNCAPARYSPAPHHDTIASLLRPYANLMTLLSL